MSVTDIVVADIAARLRRDLRATLGDEHAAIVHDETSHLQAEAGDAEEYADRAVTNVRSGTDTEESEQWGAERWYE